MGLRCLFGGCFLTERKKCCGVVCFSLVRPVSCCKQYNYVSLVDLVRWRVGWHLARSPVLKMVLCVSVE